MMALLRRCALTLLCVTSFACGESRPVANDGAPPPADTAPSDTTRPKDGPPLPQCAHPTDCMLAPQTCCGSCGAYTHDDIISLPPDQLAAYYAAQGCDDVPCPGCYQQPDPGFLPDCTPQGACTFVDLYDPAQDHTSEYTICERDSDCMLRVTECCECGASPHPGNLVAIRVDKRADFERLVCPPNTGCPECEPDYAPYFTWCGGDAIGDLKRCRVDIVGP